MTLLRRISQSDIERLFDRLADDTVDEALRERLKLQVQFTKGGGLRASRFPVSVEDTTRGILRKGVTSSMMLLYEIVARNDLPYEHIKGTALHRIENLAFRLTNLVEEANQQMPTLNMDKVRNGYSTIVEHAIADFEIGMIDGKPNKAAQNVTYSFVGDIGGNVQIAGDAAQQAINQTRVDQRSDSLALADELGKLRVALRHLPTNTSQDVAIGKIAEAEDAARGKDVDRSHTSLAAIGQGAASWILGTAKEIGVNLLVEYFEKKFGL